MKKMEDVRIKQLNPAAEQGDLALVKKIIDDNKEINLRPNQGTILKAIISGNVSLLEYFDSEFSINPTYLNSDQINEAVRLNKSREMFKHLLIKYRGLRLIMNEKTPEFVARSGDIENLKLLLSTRMPRATSDSVFAAVKARSMDCIEFLVEDYKIDGERVITDYDESIHLAVRMQFEEIVKYLREKTAEFNGSSPSDAAEKRLDISPAQPTLTPVDPTKVLYDELFDACKNMRHADVKRLLDKRLNPDIQDEQGNSPIFYAAANTDFDSIEHLCGRGANINLKNRYDETPLIYVYTKCKADFIYQLLLSKGANPYIKTKYGTIFDIAEMQYRSIELQAIREWEQENWSTAKKMRDEAAQSAKPPVQSVSLLSKFIASPIYTVQATTPGKNSESKINLTHGPLQIIFEMKSGSADWQLEVVDSEHPTDRQYSVVFDGKYSKDSILKIKKYLSGQDISGLINFLDDRGESAKAIAQCLRIETNLFNLKPNK